MAIYVIGDIQGCYQQFQDLLKLVRFNPYEDTLWFTGDLVNRGPQSLQVLRFVKSLGDRQKTVLGNHDLHLLAVAFGAGELHANDTFGDVLKAKDRDELIDWLRCQPLIHAEENIDYVMVHAGLAPQWTIENACKLANEVEEVLCGNEPNFFLRHMYGNEPDYWDERLKGIERLRVITNYLTRVRYCYVDGRLQLTFKGKPEDRPSDLLPWFALQDRLTKDKKIVFGHWAALGGKVDVPNIYALDTGCVWGNSLTAMRLGDEKRFSVSCG